MTVNSVYDNEVYEGGQLNPVAANGPEGISL